MKNRRGSNSWNLSRFCVWHSVSLVASLFLGGGFFPINAATLPAGFTESQWGSPMPGAATAMAFAPDGRLFVCLQSGQVRVINKDGVLLANAFVTLSVAPLTPPISWFLSKSGVSVGLLHADARVPMTAPSIKAQANPSFCDMPH